MAMSRAQTDDGSATSTKSDDTQSSNGGAPAAAETRPRRRWRVWLVVLTVLLLVVLAAVLAVPFIRTSLETISTDDAYVNGHVTMVAPRVAGEVARVLVDDNMRVKKG